MRPVQYFSDDYIERCRNLTADQILQFLDDFRRLHGSALLAEKEQQRKFASEVIRVVRQQQGT